MPIRNIDNFRSAAANYDGRVITQGKSGVKAGKDKSGYFNKLHDKRTMRGFRQALQQNYNSRSVDLAIAKFGLNNEKALTGKTVRNVLAFLKDSPKTMLGTRANRAEAAKGALKFLSGGKSGKSGGNRPGGHKITSTNNPFGRGFWKGKYKGKLSDMRTKTPSATVDSAHAAMREGVGNCHEKARILATSLISNPRLKGCHVKVMSSIDYDHVYVVVTDHEIKGEVNSLSDLGDNAMIVDGWTEDFYFPNQDYKIGHGNGVPNPRQAYVRRKVRNHAMEPTDEALSVTESKIRRSDLPTMALALAEDLTEGEELIDVKSGREVYGNNISAAPAKYNDLTYFSAKTANGDEVRITENLLSPTPDGFKMNDGTPLKSAFDHLRVAAAADYEVAVNLKNHSPENAKDGEWQSYEFTQLQITGMDEFGRSFIATLAGPADGLHETDREYP